jgi:hypothetical protein
MVELVEEKLAKHQLALNMALDLVNTAPSPSRRPMTKLTEISKEGKSGKGTARGAEVKEKGAPSVK